MRSFAVKGTKIVWEGAEGGSVTSRELCFFFKKGDTSYVSMMYMMTGMIQETHWEKVMMQEKERGNLKGQEKVGSRPHEKAHH